MSPQLATLRDAPFLLSKRVEGSILCEVYTIKLQEYGIRDRRIKQLELSLKITFDYTPQAEKRGIKNLENRYALRNTIDSRYPIMHLDRNCVRRTPVPAPQSLRDGTEVRIFQDAIGDRFPRHVCVVRDG